MKSQRENSDSRYPSSVVSSTKVIYAKTEIFVCWMKPKGRQMTTNPRLKQRLERAPKGMVGRCYEYWPYRVSANRNLENGELVVVVEQPVGVNNLLKVVKYIDCEDESYTEYRGKTNRKYTIEKYVPKHDDVDKFTIFMRDLTK